MEVEFSFRAKEELEWWQASGNIAALKKIRKLIESILETPYAGIGKPELLKYALSGSWSRRITDEHRLVYQVKDGIVFVEALKGHYE